MSLNIIEILTRYYTALHESQMMKSKFLFQFFGKGLNIFLKSFPAKFESIFA